MVVLTPLSKEELEGFFDEEALTVIDYFIKKSVFSQPEKIVGQNNLPIQIPKEHIEQWVVQALGVEGIGAGSYPVDVYNSEGHRAADIKMLNAEADDQGNMTNKESGEASLGQKFEGVGDILDQLFEGHEYERIKNERLNIYKEKQESVINELGLDNIYYFILLRGGNFLYIVGMKVDISELDNVTVNTRRTSDKSVFIDDFIDGRLGNAKIYKSKKRLELRLRPKAWEEGNYGIKFDLTTLVDNEGINLRNKVKDGDDLDEYGIEKATRLFS